MLTSIKHLRLTAFSNLLGLALLNTPVLAQENITSLTYEFGNATEAYLNICSLNYRLPSGHCAKVNLVNRRVEGQRGLTQLSSSQLRRGDQAWAVMIINNNGRECKFLGVIEGGGSYTFSGC